jgi:hypothetical protein
VSVTATGFDYATAKLEDKPNNTPCHMIFLPLKGSYVSIGASDKPLHELEFILSITRRTSFSSQIIKLQRTAMRVMPIQYVSNQ